MQQCEFCGSELPGNARFCGNCGRLVSQDRHKAQPLQEAPTSASDVSGATWLSPDTPFISGSSQSFARNMWTEELDEESISQTDRLENATIESSQVAEESLPLGPDLLLPGMISGNVQGVGGDAPMVHGTPQIGSVPTVRGTPGFSTPPQHMANPQAPSLYHAARTSFPQDVRTPSPNHAPGMRSPYSPHSPQPAQPIHVPQPPYRNEPEPTPHPHPHGHHHVSGTHQHEEFHTHSGRRHSDSSRLKGSRRRLLFGSSAKWIIVVVATIVVLVTGGILAAIAFNPSPTLSLSGSANVAIGGVLSLHGSGFSSGARVTLTLDHGLPLSFEDSHVAQKDKERPPSSPPQQSEAERVSIRRGSLATASLLLSAGQVEQSNSSVATGTTILVSSSGTFDIQILVRQNWSVGQHTLQAKEANSSRSATLMFNVVAQPARLSVNPLTLDFGSLEVGSKVFQSIVVVNTGGQRLTWTADAAGTKWLKILGSTGVIEPSGPQEFIYVMADTGGLSVGNYTATITIHSNSGMEQVGVKLSVIASSVKQAKLSVNPSNLDFGQVPVGQQVTMGLTVSNAGTQLLNWTADTGSTRWLSLSTNAGKIDAGQQPEMIQVTVDTTNLPPGNQSATLQFNSNGGTVQVSITLDVTMVTKPPVPLLAGTPNGFSAPGDANCTYDANAGWTCIASLSSYKAAQANLDWTASSTGVSGVSFSPQSGTLTPGQTTKVTISIPNTVCPTSADFVFTGPGNILDLPWSCGAATLSVSPDTFDANSDCTFSNGWTCFATLSSGPNAQGYLSWSASGSGIQSIGFSPANSTLAPGQKQQVTISIPSTACPASANFNFSGQNTNSVAVSWSCKAVNLQISQANIDGSDCTYDSSNGWTCMEMLSLGSNNPGNPSLSWSASSSGITGISFSPANGTLSSGQTTPVTITIPNTICPSQATFTFTSPSNTVSANWSCAAPGLSASPKSFTANSDCSLGANSIWTCMATVSSDASAQGNLSWSASGSGVNGIMFTPSNGTLSPGQTTTVTITVPTSCPASATLTFTGPANMVSIPWTCNPPTLADNQVQFNIPNGNCSYSAGQGWTCTTILTNQDTQQSLAWSATSSGVSGITVSPSSGTLSPSQTLQVTFFVPDTTCPANATVTFMGPANSVQVTWSCSTPTLAIDTSSFSNTSCTQNSDGSWTCSETLSLAQGSQGNLAWSAASDLSGVTFNPANGTLLSSSPSLTISINISSTDCTSGTFTFSGQGQGANSATASWSCTPSSTTKVVSPSSLNANNYPKDGSTCASVATLSSSASNMGDLRQVADFAILPCAGSDLCVIPVLLEGLPELI